jgi:hypothetical protein
MKVPILCAAVIALSAGCTAGAPATSLPSDVPEKHWAAQAVATVTQSGVMTAPNGRFDGNRRVSRNELIASLARLARVLERHAWPQQKTEPVSQGKMPADWKTAPVTRFRLAAVIARIAPMAQAGLPTRSAPKAFDSEAIPKSPSLKGVPRTSPVYRDLEYLAKRRMVWSGSVLLKPGSQPVTGVQVSTALAQMIAGLNGSMTDEPEALELVPPVR